VHRQKLDCALQLARTVAHDFNNALTIILGHASLLLSRMEADHPWRGSLLAIEKSAGKAAEIASDLGAFSRQEKEPRAQSNENLNVVLQRTVDMFRQADQSQKITWTTHLERKLFATKFDEAKMQQVFLKILENAVQAIEASEVEGRISIQTRNIELTEATRDRNARLAAGAYVCIEITDNGCGMEPEILPRVFEPFFTTKESEQHRGLGLAWVYGIVTNHGGGVAVSSQSGLGSSFRVYLPAEARVVKDVELTVSETPGGETILFVDDEDILLTMGQTILASCGYRVLTANSGQHALEILSEQDGAVDLVITDLVMPAMSGRELIEHVQRLSPATRIISTSGCVWPAGQDAAPAHLQKPFTSQELILKVKEAFAE
jgi:CheY-like chemotaxis protein